VTENAKKFGWVGEKSPFQESGGQERAKLRPGKVANEQKTGTKKREGGGKREKLVRKAEKSLHRKGEKGLGQRNKGGWEPKKKIVKKQVGKGATWMKKREKGKKNALKNPAMQKKTY